MPRPRTTPAGSPATSRTPASKANKQIDDYLARSLMLVTALSPEIGYDKASQIVHKADDEGTKLREAAFATGYIIENEFDRIVDPKKMVHLNH
ncbi:hypothetical protein [Actinacidiphila oryziradicis]|uniref:hypothetical protein n=1 Tax=Actinacidiphila oryziradicis TaxID=2571141 RepID=UPI0023F3D2F8|nr:hypothetical protein [Actinacidiphila oryziradicis]